MTIYLKDKDIAKELGVDSKKWETLIAPALEARGLPRKDALFDDMRCWPAVQDFLLKRAMAGATTGGQNNAFKRTKTAGVEAPAKQERGGATILDLQRPRLKARLQTDTGGNTLR
jgi:hypothetical protein